MPIIGSARALLLSTLSAAPLTARSFFVGAAAVALSLIGAPERAVAADPVLGSADPYAVLGKTLVSTSGAGAKITGNVGSPTAVTGPITFTAGSVDNLGASSALGAANAAATFLGGFGSPIDKTGINLGGLTLNAGEYSSTSSVTSLDGTLILDAQGNDNAVFIFDISTALTTGTNAAVDVINGGPGVGVYWLVGSQATLGPSTTFEGNIIAGTAVVLDDSAQILCGRAIANTEVTMSGGSPTNHVSNNDLSAGCTGGLEGGFTSIVTADVTTYSRVDNGGFVAVSGSVPVGVPEPSTLALFGGGLVGFLGFAIRQRRVRSA
jgi:hypothetical protein